MPGSPISRRRLVPRLCTGLVVALVLAAAASGASATAPVHGRWDIPTAAPIAPHTPVAVWTGSRMLVFGRAARTSYLTAPWSIDVAASYDPATNRWRKLTPPPGPKGNYEGSFGAVWTGKEMLVWGPFTHEAYNPATNRWRLLPRPPSDGLNAVGAGLVAWTGREMIGWGGGCCGDAFDDGAAYNPTTNTWRTLARSPLTGRQSPLGAWTGRELIVLGGRDGDGKALTGAAAYDPATDTWRRIASPPANTSDAVVVWSGRELLVVGGTGEGRKLPTAGIGYITATNRWRTLPPMESGRARAAAVWTGKRLFVWGGEQRLSGEDVLPAHGLAYDPKSGRWSPLPEASVQGRLDPVAVWTGKRMIVWGGSDPGEYDARVDGAAFAPATP